MTRQLVHRVHTIRALHAWWRVDADQRAVLAITSVVIMLATLVIAAIVIFPAARPSIGVVLGTLALGTALSWLAQWQTRRAGRGHNGWGDDSPLAVMHESAGRATSLLTCMVCDERPLPGTRTLCGDHLDSPHLLTPLDVPPREFTYVADVEADLALWRAEIDAVLDGAEVWADDPGAGRHRLPEPAGVTA